MEWKVAVGSDHVTAAYESGTAGGDTALFVCAHGAGGSMSDKGMLATAAALRSAGIGVVRFNFVYKEKGDRRPDFMPKLMDTVTAVVERVRSELGSAKEFRTDRLLIGGRSMGGRAASMLAARGFEAAGLLLLAYPLHPAGKAEKLRDAHLPQIRMPVLCFNGTRDPLCTPALMERALTTVTAPWQMEWVEGADHSFHVLKSSGRTDAEVMAGIAAVSRTWADRIPA
ncbi:MAG: alpha/beta family hydrolase [Gemmatimonadales bacterium]